MLVAFVGGFRAARIDADQLGAIALGLLGQAPEVQIAADRVAAPDQDQPALGKVFDLHTHLAAQGVRQAFGAGRGADGAVKLAGAELLEKA